MDIDDYNDLDNLKNDHNNEQEMPKNQIGAYKLSNINVREALKGKTVRKSAPLKIMDESDNSEQDDYIVNSKSRKK